MKREPDLGQVVQEKPLDSPVHFVEIPKFKEDTNEAIIDFLTNFFKMMTGDREDMSQWISFDRKTPGLASNNGSDDSFAQD